MNMHTKIAIATATLAQLRPGQEYPDGNINARLHYTDDEINELAASLMPSQDGQLRPFLVATHPKKTGVFFVFGGGRRRLAYERLIEAGKLPKDHPIEIQDFGHIAVKEALSRSLADNAAVPMHPADQAVTFAKLAENKSPEDIARERGMTVKAVGGLIALGEDLIPEVLKAWRVGKLDRADVQVLVLADTQTQKDAIKELEQDGGINHTYLRAQIMSNKEAVMTRLLGFVGIENARVGGVQVTQDFFGEGGVVKDLPKLEKLANKMMRELVKVETQAGWSWVDGKITELRRMHHGFGEAKAKPDYTPEEKRRLDEIAIRLKALEKDPFDLDDSQEKEIPRLKNERDDIEEAAKARAFTPKQKAGAGVMIRLRADGSVAYTRGLIRKEDKKPASSGAKAAPARREPEPDPITWDAKRHLRSCQNDALGELMVDHPKEAFAAYLAGAVCTNNEHITSGNLEDTAGRFKKSWPVAFEQLRKLSMEKLGEALVAMFPACVDITTWNGGRRKDADILIKIVGEKNYQAAMAERFDPKVYLAGASKKHMLGVLADAFGGAERKAAEDKADSAIRTDLVARLKKSGWLPPELRSKAYVAPKKAP